ncbi:MAG: transposase [Pseudonocardiales bacterium]|nr:transposase [Pseudonocardiales bacterium]
MTMLRRWTRRAAQHPPPGPFRAGFWRSPLRGPWFTAVLSVALLPGITLMFLTGLAPLILRTSDEQLARTWIAAQELRLIYHSPDRARAEQALYRWLSYCADSEIPELIWLATTIDSWRNELLAYFTTGGISNGRTEAINLLIKKIKRVGHGFRNFDNYRLRLLLHCGVDWDTIQATPITGRLPRSVA